MHLSRLLKRATHYRQNIAQIKPFISKWAEIATSSNIAVFSFAEEETDSTSSHQTQGSFLNLLPRQLEVSKEEESK